MPQFPIDGGPSIRDIAQHFDGLSPELDGHDESKELYPRGRAHASRQVVLAASPLREESVREQVGLLAGVISESLKTRNELT
jgi:hypothetical protein